MKKTNRSQQTKKERPFPNESGHKSDTIGHLVLIVASLLIFYFAFLLPLAPVYAARNWAPVSCTIMTSGMRANHSEKAHNQKFTEEVTYSYEVAGKTYQGNRYKFVEGWYTRGEKSKREPEFIAQYRPGNRTTCYVNPSDPTDVVLNRGLGVSAFLLAGPASLIIIVSAAWRLRQQRQRQRQRPQRKEKLRR